MKTVICKRVVYDFENIGKCKTIEVSEHSYAWSGSIACTGERRCIYCGDLEEKT